jgi:hypothetical protein
MAWHRITAVVAVAFALTGCANMLTVGRTTLLPSGTNKTVDDKGKSTFDSSSGGIAVHLDAQQRAIIHAGARYCAEPSPDALAAYAASLGLGASVPGTGAGSGSSALSSAAASIGLRTQSIQLMRDALYRICEASNNGRINESDSAMLLRRSQDLTAVVVAVEQLTGAVIAQQAAVTTNAQASASASLVANQQLLAEMEKQVEEKQAAVDSAETALKEATTAQEKAKTDKATADANLAQTDNESNRTAANNAKTNLESKDRIVEIRKRDLEARKEQLADAKKVRDEVKAARDSALTNSNAATASNAQFSQSQQAKALDKAASEKIATVVGEMVKDVLNKDYTVDHCMTLLASATDKDNVAVQICAEIMTRSAERAFKDLDLKISSYAHDDTSAQLETLISEKKVTPAAIKQWMKQEGFASDNVTFFVTGKEFASQRKRFLDSLK